MVCDHRAQNLVLPSARNYIAGFNEIFIDMCMNADKVKDGTGQCCLSTVDISSAYCTIGVSPLSLEFMTTSIMSQMFRFKRLDFGYKPAPFLFQSVMTRLLMPLESKFSNFYDDIILYQPNATVQSHMENLGKLFTVMAKHNFKCKINKVSLFAKQVVYMGYQLNSETETMQINPILVKSIAQLQPPTNIKELQRVLGILGYNAKFIPDFYNNTTILYTLLKGKNREKDFKWTEDHQVAFENLKKSVIQSTLLNIPNLQDDYPLAIFTDSSDNNLSCCLASVRPIPGNPTKMGMFAIAYLGRSFTERERNFAIYYKELLAVNFAVTNFIDFIHLKGHVTIYTDATLVKDILSLNTALSKTPRIARLQLALMGIDFDMRILKSEVNCVADGLSRIPQGEWKDPDQLQRHNPVDTDLCYMESDSISGKSFVIVKDARTKLPVNTLLAANTEEVNKYLIRKPIREYFEAISREKVQEISQTLMAISPISTYQHLTLTQNPLPDSISIKHFQVAQQHLDRIPSNDYSFALSMQALLRLQAKQEEPQSPVVATINQLIPIQEHPGVQSYIIPPLHKEDDQPIVHFNIHNLHEEQMKDPYIAPIYQYLTQEILPKTQREARKVLLLAEQCILVNKLVYRLYSLGGRQPLRVRTKLQLLLPKTYLGIVISHTHSQLMHAGVVPSYLTMIQSYYHPGLFQEIWNFIKSCPECATRTLPKFKNILYTPGLPDKPLNQLSCDVVHFTKPGTSRVEQTHKQLYVFLITDNFSLYTVLTPVPNLKAATLAKALLHKWLLVFGFTSHFNFLTDPQTKGTQVRSDNFKSFSSQIYTSLLHYLGVSPIYSVPLRSTSNGIAERHIRSVQTLLRKSAANHWHKVKEILPLIQHSLNSMAKSHLGGLSSYQVLFGVESTNVYTDLIKQHTPDLFHDNPSVERLHSDMHLIHNLIRDHLPKAREEKLKAANEKRKPTNFKVGDIVYRRVTVLDLSTQSRKLANYYVGPLKITKIHGNTACSLIDVETQKDYPFLVNIDHLKTVIPRPKHLDVPQLTPGILDTYEYKEKRRHKTFPSNPSKSALLHPRTVIPIEIETPISENEIEDPLDNLEQTEKLFSSGSTTRSGRKYTKE